MVYLSRVYTIGHSLFIRFSAKRCLNCKAVSWCTYQEYIPLDIVYSFVSPPNAPTVSLRLEGHNEKSTSWCCNHWAGRTTLKGSHNSRRQTEQCAFYDLTGRWQKSIWSRYWNAPREWCAQSTIRRLSCTAWFVDVLTKKGLSVLARGVHLVSCLEEETKFHLQNRHTTPLILFYSWMIMFELPLSSSAAKPTIILTISDAWFNYMRF